ncbi:MAG: 30S ribosome-binding factor RbfA [Alphaproteobacteria bacterium]|nr:30S ribosome-binding factor RbfA [Alphaproteobacteria bacterium]
MKHHKHLEPSQRQLRAGELIRHIVAKTMQKGHFHHEALLNTGQITISEVRPSPDLKNATIFVYSLGGKNMDEIINALNSDAHIFQKDINKHSNLKFTPKVRFVKDDSFANASRIDELLRDIHIPDDTKSSEEK